MTIQAKVLEIEARLERAGSTVDAMCKLADIARSTWVRWKAGRNSPNFETWGRVEAAVAVIEMPQDAEKGAA